MWQPPRSAAGPAVGIESFAGRYRTAGGTIDIISVSNATLFDRTLPDVTPTSLVRIAPGVFGIADDPTLVVFLRDAAGSVKQCLFYLPNGQTMLSRRMK